MFQKNVTLIFDLRVPFTFQPSYEFEFEAFLSLVIHKSIVLSVHAGAIRILLPHACRRYRSDPTENTWFLCADISSLENKRILHFLNFSFFLVFGSALLNNLKFSLFGYLQINHIWLLKNIILIYYMFNKPRSYFLERFPK